MIADHLFVSETDGGLYDTRDANWSARAPVRRRYEGAGANPGPLDLNAIKAALRSGGWAWPGGYPLFFVMSDGSALSFHGARKAWRQIVAAYLSANGERHYGGWRVEGVDVNWEDGELICDATGERIPAAYGDA